MAEIAMIAAIAGTAVGAAGTIAAGQHASSAAAAEQQRLVREGAARKTSLEFEAKQLDVQAKNERAFAQREMFEKRRTKDIALSTLQARSAASGFSATDPTTLSLADEISRYGTLQEQMAMFGGESRANDLQLGAAGRRFSGESAMQSAIAQGEAAKAEGRAKRNASYFSAAGTILGGLSSMAGKFPTGGSGGAPSGGRYG
jgi:hypothetical protein